MKCSKQYAMRGFVGLAAVLLAGGTAAAAEHGRQPLGDLTGPWRLFVDDYPVAESRNVTRTYHPFDKYEGNPVLVGDKPWEGGDIYLYGTVLPSEDGTGYRMWYQTLPFTEGEKNHVLYATSQDGIHWEKPDLGIVERHGSTDNNILLASGEDGEMRGGSFMPSVIHRPWDPDPARRYAILTMTHGGKWGAWFSPDGINFTYYPDNPVCPSGGDAAQFVWDPHLGKYLGYGKVVTHVNGTRRRCVGYTATDDITSWESHRMILAPDAVDDRWADPPGVHRTSFYGLSAFAYESMYLGFLWVFRATDPEGYLVGPIFCELVTSQDGIRWLRQEGDRPPILPLGEPGAWDDGMVFTATHPLVEGDTVKLYYGGFDEEHSCKMNGKIGLATLRKDGFASLDAGAREGTILTKRLTDTEGPLHVNYTARGGWVKVEVLDGDGNVLDGYGQADCRALTGDSVDATVAWADKTALPTGAGPIRLRFVLEEASIYSFMAGPDAEVLAEPAGPTLATLYTFEDNWMQDKLAEDGRQEIAFVGQVRPARDSEHVAFGQQAARIGSDFCQLNTIEIHGTRNLGTHFTLALHAASEDNACARLFSSFENCGPIMNTDLVFEADPTGRQMPGLRIYCKGIEVTSRPIVFDDGAYHHLAVTYDDGAIRFYLDGQDVGGGFVPGGHPVVVDRNLFVGEDPTLGRIEQFTGYVDDVLVLGRALSPDEIARLAGRGAERFFDKRRP